MAGHKEKSKKLKEPDQFQAKGADVIEKIVAHQKLLAGIVVALVLVAAGVAGSQWYSAKKLTEQAKELGDIQIVFDGENKSAVDARSGFQTQLAPLNDEVKALEKDEKSKKKNETKIKELKGKVAGIEKQRDEIKPDHTKSLKLYSDFFNKYKSSPAGWMSAIQAANIHLDNNKLQDAHDLIKEVLTKSNKDPFYQVYPRFTLVGILEDMGKYDDALSQLDVIMSLGNAEHMPRILLSKGRILYLKNDLSKAKETLSMILENHGESPEAQKAKSMQLLLN